MAQQTAVEWLLEIFWGNEGMLTTKQLEEAKAMEKEQIINTYLSACVRVTPYGNYTDSAEQYYYETYKK